MKESKEMKCDPCERDFEHKVGELVKEGKAPTHEERLKREHEVKSAFGVHHPADHTEIHHTTSKPASKPASNAGKHPVAAGAAKMKK